MTTKIHSGLAKTKVKFMAALPTILFFLFLFYSIILLFGISRVIMVSVITILFKTNYQKCLTLRRLLILIGTQFLMALLSFCATLNLPLCILLNLAVPFLLVFLQASQFNQLGYFANAMCFVFLQLRPVGLGGLAMLMGAMAYGLAVLCVALFLCSLRNRKTEDFGLAQKGLLLLAEALRQRMDPEREESETGEVFQILQGLYMAAYKSRGLTYVVTAQGRIQYMFALLFQRAVYLLTNPYQIKTLAQEDSGEVLDQLAQYMELAGTGGFNQDLPEKEGGKLLARTEERDEAACVFTQNFLRLFLMILENISQMDHKKDHKKNHKKDHEKAHKKAHRTVHAGWKLPQSQRPLKRMICQLRTDTFETRFALRLSVVLTAGFTYNMISQANHGYWFVLNAFLLLRPMYEDSAYRMKSRFIGTAAGCVLLQFLLPLFHGTSGHILFATIMAVGLYMEAAGTWQQALFSTCFALSLTTLAIPEPLAVELRFLYVIMAVLTVLVINRFFFPTSLKSQFHYNLNQLFHMHHLYLQMLAGSLRVPLDYGVICDQQIRYHLIHDQILAYLKKAGDKESEYIKELLWISWYMVSEAEQMLYLINARRADHPDIKQMEDYFMFNAVILSEIQKDMNMKEDAVPQTGLPGAYKRNIEGEMQLSVLMEQYSKQLSRLYLCVCGRGRGIL